MIVLVTGGAGFIGSHTVDLLLKEKHTVIVIDNESAKANSKFYWDDRAANHKLDIRDYDSIRPLFNGVDYVIHLAAQARIQPSLLLPEETIENNVFGTANVLRCAKEASVKRVVFASSSSVYGDGELPNKEENDINPLNPYAQSKAIGEDLCRMYNDLGLETIMLRYFNVYGPRQPDKGPWATVLAKFEEQLREGQKLTVVGDGTQKRDFTHVGDVARANLEAAFKFQKPEKLGKPYNVGTGRNYSMNEIVKMLKAKKVKQDKRPAESQETLASLHNTGRTIGWTWTRYLETYLEEIRKSTS